MPKLPVISGATPRVSEKSRLDTHTWTYIRFLWDAIGRWRKGSAAKKEGV